MTLRIIPALALSLCLAACAHSEPQCPQPVSGAASEPAGPAAGAEHGQHAHGADPAHGAEPAEASEDPADATHAHRHEGHDRHHRFEDPERWAEHFEDPERDEWQKPEVVVELLELEPDDVVADIGSATGYFPVRIAAKVPQGRVWGVDIEPSMVRYLNERAREQELGNLFSILGKPDDPLLPETVDVVLMVDTYHHVSDRTAYFEGVAEHLAPDGRLVIVDFKKGELPVGPPDEMKIAPEQVVGEIEAAGYTLEQKVTDRLPHQYVLVFAREG